MQNRKAYIAVSFAVFGLIGACAPTGPSPLYQEMRHLPWQHYPIAGKLIMQGC